MNPDTVHDDELLTLAFSIQSNPAAYAVFIGAGVSAASGIPTAWQVLTTLVTDFARASGTEGDVDPMHWYQDTFDEEPRYETVLAKLAPTPTERERLLAQFFEPTIEERHQGQKQPTAAHHAIARLVAMGMIRVIITLNFDGLMESALREVGVEPTIVATTEDAAAVSPLHTLQCCVIHLHGFYKQAASMLNTSEELGQYAPARQKLLTNILENYGLIIAGWSAIYDPAVRDAITGNYPGRYTLTWCEPREPSEEATRLRVLKMGTLIALDADTCFGKLADAVTALQNRNSRHPLTIPVAIATAKRELSGKGVAISLHDTLNHEFSRLHGHPDFHPVEYHTTNFRAVLERTEDASLVCSALVASLAYWGTVETDKWWIDQLRRFAVVTRDSGESRMLALREITGTFLLYAAGVSAVASKRYDLVDALLALTRKTPRARYSDAPQHLTDVLVPGRESTPTFKDMRKILEPVIREATGLGPEPAVDAWQEFEILRLVAAVTRQPHFTSLTDDVVAHEQAMSNVQGDPNTDPATTQLHQEKRDKALGKLADQVLNGAVRVLTRDTHDQGWRVPIADQLAADVEQNIAHPLNVAEVGQTPEILSAALKAVSVSLGRVGYRKGERETPVPGAPGVFSVSLSEEEWLDL